MNLLSLPVLFVDDDRSNLLLFRMGFEPRPVLLASNADEALQILERHQVSAMVTDQRMPGLTGTALAAIVRDRHPQVTRILLTAEPDLPEAQEALRSGLVARVMSKPWTVEQIKAVLAELVGATEP
jgi:formate hydrogenlyase transcriptional activator